MHGVPKAHFPTLGIGDGEAVVAAATPKIKFPAFIAKSQGGLEHVRRTRVARGLGSNAKT
jgi:hypothetical protein